MELYVTGNNSNFKSLHLPTHYINSLESFITNKSSLSNNILFLNSQVILSENSSIIVQELKRAFNYPADIYYLFRYDDDCQSLQLLEDGSRKIQYSKSPKGLYAIVITPKGFSNIKKNWNASEITLSSFLLKNITQNKIKAIVFSPNLVHVNGLIINECAEYSLSDITYTPVNIDPPSTSGGSTNSDPPSTTGGSDFSGMYIWLIFFLLLLVVTTIILVEVFIKPSRILKK